MSFFGHFMKQVISYKMHEKILENRFELQDRLQTAREEARLKLAERALVERERKAHPKMHTFEIERVGKVLGAVVIAETASDSELIKSVELLSGERIKQSAILDGFYLMTCQSGVVVKARLK